MKRSIPVKLDFEGYGASTGTAVVLERNPPERAARAGIALFLCLCFAAVSVFVPLFHFVLVPTFVITGITLFALRLREHETLLEVKGHCPSCKEEKLIETSGRFVDGRSLRCNQCATKMHVLVGEGVQNATLRAS
jgi:hypothetical protein